MFEYACKFIRYEDGMQLTQMKWSKHIWENWLELNWKAKAWWRISQSRSNLILIEIDALLNNNQHNAKGNLSFFCKFPESFNASVIWLKDFFINEVFRSCSSMWHCQIEGGLPVLASNDAEKGGSILWQNLLSIHLKLMQQLCGWFF